MRFAPLSTALALLVLCTGCGADDPRADSDADAGPGADPATSAAAAPSEGPDIWVATLTEGEGGVIQIGEPRNVTDRPGYDNQPHFLADGSFLYTRESDGNTDIWRWEPTSNATTAVVTSSPESEYSPTPLPGGDGFSAVRVEADSAQRLWRFDMEGGAAELVLADVQPVGYHAWVSPDTVALFVLGDPPTLRLASVSAGTAITLADDIGRSLQPVPERHAFSYAQRGADGGMTLRVYDVATGEASDQGAAVDGVDFHAWTPSGVLLQGSGSRIFFWHSAMGHWMPAADFTAQGLQVSRLAVSPDGRWLAIVADRSAP